MGWREWVSLPAFDVRWIKAKVDTGARTSALNAVDLEVLALDGCEVAEFTVFPWQATEHSPVRVRAEIIEHRLVKSSVGVTTDRPVIRTPVTVAGTTHDVELTLVDRSDMGFRMLLGRQALRGYYYVDPGRSYVGGRPDRRTLAANRGR